MPKTILVTGASGDIGLACAQALAKPGNTLIVFSHRHVFPEKKFKQAYPGVTVIPIRVDLSQERSVEKAFAQLRQRHIRRIDVLVHAAGDLLARRSVQKLTWDFVEQSLAVNLKSGFLTVMNALPLLRRGSSIIFITSMTALSGKGDRSSAYSLAKGALVSWAKSLAHELGPRGIRVNTVAPGYIKGQFHRKYSKRTVEREHARRNPLGRVGQPRDVAEAVVFLAEQGQGYTNGVTIEVNGGDVIR